MRRTRLKFTRPHRIIRLSVISIPATALLYCFEIACGRLFRRNGRSCMQRVPADKGEDVTRETVAAVTARRVASGHDLQARIFLAAADKS